MNQTILKFVTWGTVASAAISSILLALVEPRVAHKLVAEVQNPPAVVVRSTEVRRRETTLAVFTSAIAASAPAARSQLVR